MDARRKRDATRPTSSAATRKRGRRRSMDATILTVALYLTATLAAALVTGVAGFAFGLVAAGVWLHILTPMQTATLIIAFGLVVQGISVWKLRHALRWSRLWPFLLGAAFGVPLGVALLGWARPDCVRVTVGVVLGLNGAISIDTVWFFGIGLPALLAGTWLGLRLYGHLDEANFRKLVLVLLLVSGLALAAPALAPLFG